MSDYQFTQMPQTPEQQPSDYWSNLGGQLGAGGYSALNSLGMGLPDWVMKNIVGGQPYQNIQSLMASHPTASTIGDVAGLVGSLAIPVGGEFGAASKLAGALGAGKTAKTLGAAADIARGAQPVAGLLGNVGKGILQAAPQALIRTATGNITPQQGELGLALGGGTGALGGVLGKVAGKIPSGKVGNALNDTVNEWLLGSSGIRTGDIRPVANYGIPSTFKNARLSNAKNLIEETSQQLAKNGLAGLPEEKTAAWLNNTFAKPFAAMDQAWSQRAPTGEDMGRFLLGKMGGADPNYPGIAKFAQAEGGKPFSNMVDDLVGMADNKAPLPQIDKYLEQYGQKARTAAATGDWTPGMDEAAVAANELRGAFRNMSGTEAEKLGLATKNDIQQAFDLYPVRQILTNEATRNALKLGYSTPGSPTFEKYALGLGAAGGGLLGAQDKKATPLDLLKDVAIGSVAGGLAGPMLSRLANAGISRGAGVAKNLLMNAGEGGGGIGKVAAGLTGGMAGGAAPIAKAAQLAPLAAGLTPGQQKGTESTDAISAPRFTEVPSLQQMVDSKDPWVKTMGARIYQDYATKYAYATNPATGKNYTPDDLVKLYYDQTNGFAPLDSTNILSNDPGFNTAVSHDMQVASALNRIDWNNLEKWYGYAGQGGFGQVLGAAATLNVPGAREAQNQLQQLLIATGNDPVVMDQVERIMRTSGMSNDQRKNAVIRAIMAKPGAFTNATVLQNLGLLR